MLKTPQPIGSHGDSSEAFMNNPCSTWRHEIFIGSLCPWSLEQWVWGSRVPPPSLKGAGEGCPRPGPTSDPWRGAGSYGGTGTSVSAGKTNPPPKGICFPSTAGDLPSVAEGDASTMCPQPSPAQGHCPAQGHHPAG